jgi:hypothetical protein
VHRKHVGTTYAGLNNRKLAGGAIRDARLATERQAVGPGV